MAEDVHSQAVQRFIRESVPLCHGSTTRFARTVVSHPHRVPLTSSILVRLQAMTNRPPQKSCLGSLWQLMAIPTRYPFYSVMWAEAYWFAPYDSQPPVKDPTGLHVFDFSIPKNIPPERLYLYACLSAQLPFLP